VNERRKAKLNEIFDKLDDDKDNQISGLNINLKNISADLQ
jgi:hypothetical protein